MEMLLLYMYIFFLNSLLQFFCLYFLPGRNANYQFAFGRSSYTVVADLSATLEDAVRSCQKVMGKNAKLLNISYEEEFFVINRALKAMDIVGSNTFWIGGFVNDPHPGFRKWGHCEPGECVINLFKINYVL